MSNFDLYSKVFHLNSLQEDAKQRHMHAALSKPGCAFMRVIYALNPSLRAISQTVYLQARS